jgi:hypothetical protein
MKRKPVNAVTAEYVRSVLNYDAISGRFTWSNGKPAGTRKDSGYIRIIINGSSYYAHRLAWLYMTGEWPAHDIDHKNREPSDNRWSNLRHATRSENNANRPKRANSRGRLKGIYLSGSGRWTASIRYGGKERYLGSFSTEEDAHAAYVRAAREIFGEFARTA